MPTGKGMGSDYATLQRRQAENMCVYCSRTSSFTSACNTKLGRETTRAINECVKNYENFLKNSTLEPFYGPVQ